MPHKKGLFMDLVIASCAIAWSDLSYAQIGAAAERAAGRAAVSAAERQAASRATKDVAESSALRMAGKGADRVVKRWTSSLCNRSAPCPLPQKTSNTFVGGSYDEVVLGQDTVLYRAYHDPLFKFGKPGERFSYWTRSSVKGTQAVVDSAIPTSNKGNIAEQVVAAQIPKWTRIFEGRAAPIKRGPVGGGNQILMASDQSGKLIQLPYLSEQDFLVMMAYAFYHVRRQVTS
jgi:hypothetical protein